MSFLLLSLCDGNLPINLALKIATNTLYYDLMAFGTFLLALLTFILKLVKNS